MTEDFVFVDHRPLSFGTVDRERYLRLLAPLFDETPDVRWTMVSNHGITDHIACGLIRHSGTTNEGGRFDNPVWGVISERDQLWSRVEAFTTREEAVARFAELTASTSTSAAIARRGDRLSLTPLQVGGRELLRLMEHDESGAVLRSEVFEVDQVDDAFARLEKLFLTELGERGGGWAALVRAVDAMNRRDLEGLRVSMSDDFQLVDHRPLSFGTVDRDEYVESFPPIWEQSDDVRWTVMRAHEVAEHVVLFMRSLHGTTSYGGEFDTLIWNVTVERDGLLARIEDFETEAAARARFTELTADEAFS
jgi:hypothetical protein